MRTPATGTATCAAPRSARALPPSLRALGAALALATLLGPAPARALDWADFGAPGAPDATDFCLRPATTAPVGATCPASPTLAQCTDPAFLASPCGAPYLSGADPSCADLLNGRESLCLAGRPLEPMMSWDTLADVEGVLDDFDDEAVTYAGLAGTYAGAVVDSRARRADADGAGLAGALVREWWATNCSVQSCEEYVYEKYYDLSDFERHAGSLGDDWRAVFDAVYGADGIAGRHLRGYAGSSVGWVEPTATRTYPNEFYAYRPWEHPIDWIAVAAADGFPDVYGFDALGGVAAFFAGCAVDPVTDTITCDATAHPAAVQAAATMNAAISHYDAARYERVEPVPPARFPPPQEDAWAWHRRMSDALAGVPDERLLWLAELQDEFATVRAEIERLRAQIARDADAVALIDAADPSHAAGTYDRRSVVRALRAGIARERALAARLGHLLAVAEANGCLDRSTVSPCDWSPQWLAEDVFGLLDARRAADYQRCLAFTGNDFRRLWDADPSDGEGQWLTEWAADHGDFCVQDGAIAPGCALRDSYVGDERSVDLYVSTVEAWFDSLAFPIDPETGAPILGESAADEGREGDALFDVDFDYDMGWRVTDLTAPSPCDVGLRAGAGAHVSATAFGVEGELLGAALTAGVNAPDNAVGLGLTVLGVDLYADVELPAEHDGARRYQFHVLEEPALSDGVSTQKTFYVGWVPFTFQAGLSGTVGVRVAADAEAELCDPADLAADLSFGVTPFATVRAYASGALGVPGVSLGVRADLTVIDLRAPFEAALALSLTDDRFTSQARLDVELELLRGSVSLVAELLVKTWRRRLFGWPGVEWTTTPLANGFDFGLGLVRAAAGARGAAPTVATAPLYADFGDECLLPHPVPEPAWYVDANDDHVSGATVSPAIGAAPLVLEGDALAGREGVWGQAVRTGGAGALVSASPAPPVGDAFSLSFWALPEGPQAATLLARGTAGAPRLALRADADGTVLLSARCGDTLRGRRSLALLRDGRWNHVVVTYQPDGGHVAGWLNGALAVQIAGCALAGPLDDLALGRSLATGAPEPFTGRFDELAWWPDVVLAREDVYELFDRGSGARPVSGEGAAVPQGVTDLAASSGDGTIRLDWTNPPSLAVPGEGYDEVEVRFALDAAPRTATEGTSLLRTSLRTSVIHDGLPLGQVVHYTLFLHRTGQPAVRGPSVAGVVSFALPGPVTALTAAGGVGRVDLAWTNPTDRSFWRVRVMRGVDATPPPDLHHGVLVCEGRLTSCLDENLDSNQEYTYSVFSLADGYQHGPPAVVRATTIDTDVTAPDREPPGPVSDLVATPGDARVTLRWTPPPAPDFDHVRIQRAWEGGFQLETLPDRPTTSFEDTGLVNEVRWFYSLAAVDRAGNVGPAVSVTVVPSAIGWTAPAGFAAVGTAAGVDLSWSSPGGGAAVRVVRSRLRSVDDARSGSLVYEGSATAYADRAVAPGETWHYSAFTVVGGDRFYGPARASATRLDLPPGPVTDFVARPGLQEATLSWTLPSDDDLDRVEIRLATDETPGPQAGVLAYAGRGTGTTVTGLTPATRYYLAAYVYDRAGQASVAVPQLMTTQAVDEPPGPVTDLAVVPGSTSAAVSWTNPPDADLARVDLRYSSLAPPEVDSGSLAASGLLEETVLGGLAADRTYHVAVFAFDRAGQASAAARATFRTLPPPDDPPGPVTDLVVEAGEWDATVRWTPPADADLDRVELRLGADAPPGPTEGTLAYSGTATEATIPDLAPVTTYHLAAYAFDAGGNVSGAATTTFTTVDLPPPPVTGLGANPFSSGAELFWDRPAVPDYDHVVVRQSTLAPPGWDEGTVVFTGRVSGILLSNLTPLTTYHHTVFVFDAAGQRSEGASHTFTTLAPDDLPPGPVTDLAVAPGPTSAVLTWTLPPDTDLDRLEVRRSAVGPPPPTGGVLAWSGLDTTATLTGLTPDTRYHVSVYPWDAAGQLGQEATVEFTTLAADPPPGPVTGVTAAPFGACHVVLSWTNPGDADFDRVEVRTSPDGPPAVDGGTLRYGGAAETAVLQGLPCPATHHVAVYPFDTAGGHGAPGETTVTVAYEGPIAAPTGFLATDEPGAVTVTWTNPASAGFSHTEIRWAYSNFPNVGGGTLAYEGPGTSVTITGLETGRNVYLAAWSHDLVGTRSARVVDVGQALATGIEVRVPPPRSVFVGETLPVRADYATGAGVTPPDRFVWRSVGAVPVGVDAPVDPFDAYLTFATPGEAAVELTVSNGVESGAGTLRFTVEPWPGAANDLADHPFAEPVAVPAGGSLAADDRHVYVLDRTADFGARTFRVVDGATRQERGTTAFEGAELVAVGAGRVYALDHTRQSLHVVDVSDPTAPDLLTPYAIAPGGPQGWVAEGDTLVAPDDSGAAVLELTATADGLAEVGPVVLPDGRRTPHVALGHGGRVLYVALEPQPLVAPALWAYDLDAPGGPAPVAWLDLGEALETAEESVVALVQRGDRLVAGLSGPLGARRYVVVDTSVRDALTPVRAPAETFAAGWRLALAGETLFALGLDPRGVVATIDLGGEPAQLGPVFPGPAPGAGDLALFPASAPTELWVAAAASSAERVAAGLHVFPLDAPRAGGDGALPAAVAGAVGGDAGRVVVAGDDRLWVHDPNAAPFDLPAVGWLPHAVHTADTWQPVLGLALRGDVLFVVEPGGATGDVLRSVDLSDATAPAELDALELGRSGCARIFPLAADGPAPGRVVLGCDFGGWQVVDASDPAALVLGAGSLEMAVTSWVEPTTGRGTHVSDLGAIVQRDFTAADPFAAATTSLTGLWDIYPFHGAPLWTDGAAVWLSNRDVAEQWDVSAPAAPVVAARVPQGNAAARAWRMVPEHGVWLSWGAGGLAVNRFVDGAPTRVRAAHWWPDRPGGFEILGALSVHGSRVAVPDSGGRAALWRPVGAYRPLNEYASGAPGETLTYTFQASTVTGARETCRVTGGTCAVTASSGGIATVEWTLPGAAGWHELTFVAGDPTFFTTWSDRLRVEEVAP